MDNNELNNNLGNQILMGDTQPIEDVNKPEQPNNNLNVNQGLNTVLQNNLNQNQEPQPVQPQPQEPQPQETSVDTNDNIFSDIQPVTNEPKKEEIKEVKQKKNKGPIIIIIILLLIVLGLSGYIVYDKFLSNETKSNTTEETKETKTNEVKTVSLKDDSREVVYASIDEKHDGVIRRIPYVNIESKYADEINNEIEELTKNGYLQGQASQNYYIYKVDYHYYENGDIVSILFSWEMENGYSTSKIYNINKTTGKKVTKEELLKQVNIDENSFNTKLVDSYKLARPLESIENNTEAIIKECYQKDIDTLTNSNIKGMYINNAELYVLFDVNYPAGAGIGEAILNINSNTIVLNPILME